MLLVHGSGVKPHGQLGAAWPQGELASWRPSPDLDLGLHPHTWTGPVPLGHDSSIEHRSIKHQASSSRHQASGIEHQALRIKHPPPSISFGSKPPKNHPTLNTYENNIIFFRAIVGGQNGFHASAHLTVESSIRQLWASV